MAERADIDIAARLGGAPKHDAQRVARAPTTGRSTRPFSRFEWMIALRYLRPRRKEAFVSVISIISFIGIALGVATLIIVMSVMNGFRHELLSRILGLNGHVVVQGASGNLPSFDAVAARVRAVPGVTRVAPIVDGQVMASSDGVSMGVLVRGMRRADLKSLTTVSNTLSPGALGRFQGGESVIIGARLADKLRLYPGMTITLIAPRGNVTPFGTTPRVKSYTIAGTFRIGMTEYDQTFVFMPLEEAQLYFNLDNTVSGLEIMVADPDNLGDRLLNSISAAAGPYDRVTSWQDVNSSLFGALQVERNVMFLILTLIILVAALNIISGLIMLVKDKSGDIAILRTMGATRGAVMRIFFIAGASIGVVGTLLGFLIGVLFCSYIEELRQFLSSLSGTTLFNPEIYFLSRMPAKMEPDEVISVLIMALTLSFLATIIPSWRAARLDPVEALRYE
ncbi:MAG: lipoprotein-releasing ABC transporter permease subunit [Proteobacteria bacterium]|nr:lipoprotein-releasing ABC transporter permease subunit [Pseudomonadota bacterium]